MAIYRKGADPDALDRSAELLVNYAREAAASRQTVSGVLGALKGNWGGENLQSLISQWPAIEAQIDRFGTDLGRLGDRLSHNAEAQRGTSGSGVSLTSAAFITAGLPGGTSRSMPSVSRSAASPACALSRRMPPRTTARSPWSSAPPSSTAWA